MQAVSLNDKMYVVYDCKLSKFLEDKFSLLLSVPKQIIKRSHTDQNKSRKPYVTADLQNLFSPKALSKHKDAFPSYR